MRRINSREKGKRIEREAAEALTSLTGYRFFRGQQYRGGSDSPDIRCLESPWDKFHFEVKGAERINLWQALEQARRDGPKACPVVIHRKKQHPFLVTMDLETFVRLVRWGSWSDGQDSSDR